MSVFTPLQREELEAFLAPYGLGRLRDFEGIAAGSGSSTGVYVRARWMVGVRIARATFARAASISI